MTDTYNMRVGEDAIRLILGDDPDLNGAITIAVEPRSQLTPEDTMVAVEFADLLDFPPGKDHGARVTRILSEHGYGALHDNHRRMEVVSADMLRIRSIPSDTPCRCAGCDAESTVLQLDVTGLHGRKRSGRAAAGVCPRCGDLSHPLDPSVLAG